MDHMELTRTLEAMYPILMRDPVWAKATCKHAGVCHVYIATFDAGSAHVLTAEGWGTVTCNGYRPD